MDISKLDVLAAQNKDLPEGLALPYQLYFNSVKYIYALYSLGRIDKEKASKYKKHLIIDFDRAMYEVNYRSEMYGYYQDNIRRAGMLRSEMCKSRDKDEVLKKALETISAMTGESVTEKVIKRNLELG